MRRKNAKPSDLMGLAQWEASPTTASPSDVPRAPDHEMCHAVAQTLWKRIKTQETALKVVLGKEP
jgi:hypothetical protein